MSNKTARSYRDERTLPSARKKVRAPRLYRTRPDPFAAVWAAVEKRLQAEPRLLAKTLFDWLRRQHPGQFLDSHRRTFERRVRQWRATHGSAKAVMFRQIHEAGDLAASDFTHMSALGVTIAGQRFEHMVDHFVLTYSNWESVTLCASESFEALSDGLQNALWELGGVPRRHRSDSLTAAVNNLSATREFQTRYRDLLSHYGLSGQRINVRQAHENGDAESSHGHFKSVVDQFQWSRLPKAAQQQFQTLRDGSFLARRENVLVFGKPGSGKTHALCAVAEQLVLNGHAVLFTTCSLLVQELLAAKRDLKLERFLKKLASFAALIIDDLGYVQQSREEMEVLFTLLAERYERGSVLLTSNLPFSQWTAIFKDPMTTAAAIDRLVHHSVIVELNVPSFRLETAKGAKPTPNAGDPATA